MFNRYTERARRVIFYSRFEASEFGCPYIETEFLLLGIARENKHVLTRWLGEGDWQTILRDEVAKRFYSAAKIPTSVDLPLSNEAKRVLAYAAEEAELLSHPWIGVEHLFLGLMRESESWAAQFLTERGVELTKVREALAKEGVETGLSDRNQGSKISERSFELLIVLDDGAPPLHLASRARVPVAGEIISIDGSGGSKTYEVVKVEWKVVSNPVEGTTASKVLIHVQEVHGTS